VIASRLGLVAFAVVALGLAVVLGIDIVHAPARVDRALVPGFDAERVMYMRWPDAQVRRDVSGWLYCNDTAAGERSAMTCHGWRADAGAVDAALAALRGARWHRRGDARSGGAVATRLVAGLDGATITIGLAAPVEGADQRWLVVGTNALLVDGWVARALFPGRDALIDRDVLPGVENASRIDIGHVHLAIPCRVGEVWVEVARCDAVVQALAGLKVEAIASRAVTPDLTAAISVITRAGREHHVALGHDPACGAGRVAIAGNDGDACVSETAWKAAFAAAEPLAGPPDAIVDRRPLPITPVKLVLGNSTLDLVTMRLDGKETDRDAVTALVAALSAPAEEVTRVPAGALTATLTATDRAGISVTLEVVGNVVARSGEPVALRPSREALATMARPAAALLDPTRWVEDPLAVAELVVDGVTYRRGAVVGEWTREPRGQVKAAAVDAAALALSHLRAPAVDGKVGPAVHHVSVKLVPPVGMPQTHQLDVDRHCAANLDGMPVQLEPATCAAIGAIR
jgi:hypothetical protein